MMTYTCHSAECTVSELSLLSFTGVRGEPQPVSTPTPNEDSDWDDVYRNMMMMMMMMMMMYIMICWMVYTVHISQYMQLVNFK